MSLILEHWKPIVGHEGTYAVSDTGQIKNVQTGRILKATLNQYGYWTIKLRGHNEKVHSLVASAFVGPRPAKHDVNHKDGVKTNNFAGNLEYLNRRDHMHHSLRLGLNTIRRKLREEEIPLIRQLIVGQSYGAVAEQFGVSPGTIWDVVQRKTWAHIP